MLESDYVARAREAIMAVLDAELAVISPELESRIAERSFAGERDNIDPRLARAAGLDCADQLSPHSLRHTVTLSLDAGVALRDVQDYAGHKDPRTTRRYDHTRHSLDRSAAYTLAAYLP
jgi:integrase